MNSRTLILNAMNGQSTPRPACGPLAVHFCARDAGHSIRQYTLEPQVMAECIVRYYEKYQPDAVWVSADTWVTAQAAGATVSFPGRDEPMVGMADGGIRTLPEVERLPAPDPTTQGRQPLMIEALRRVRQALGPDVFIVGCFDQAPFSLACALMGIHRLMLNLSEAPELVAALLKRCEEYCVAYGLALCAAGADMLSMGDSPAGLVGPQLYRRFAWPAEKAVFAQLRAQTDCKLSLHICGQAQAILSDMAQTGADVLELDHCVPIELACQRLDPRITIWGNLDPVGLLLQGSPAEVTRAARRTLAAIAECGHTRFVLSSGCTLAPATPPANVHALIRAVHEGD